jgi:hypothetical protein
VIAWNQVTGAAGYGVVRQNPDGTCWSLTSQLIAATTIQEPSPTAAGTYQYQVAVRLINGQTGLSNWTPYSVASRFSPPPRTSPTVVPPAPPALEPPPRGTRPKIVTGPPGPATITIGGNPVVAHLSWTMANPVVGMRYEVQRSNPSNPASFLRVTDLHDTKWTDEGAPWPGPYIYRVAAYYPDGTIGTTDQRWDPPTPVNPNGLTARLTSSSVFLQWYPVPGVSYYMLLGPGPRDYARLQQTHINMVLPNPGTWIYQVGSYYVSPNGVVEAHTLPGDFTTITVTVPPPPP